MPVPTLITDLSATAASNSPSGSEAPTEGDNHLRTAYAFIKQLYDGVSGVAYPTLAQLASTASAADGDALVGVKRTSTGALATTVHAWMEKQHVTLGVDFCVADGSTDDNTAMTNAIASGKDIFIPRGLTVALSGNVTGFANGQRIFGGGCFKKIGATVQPLFLLPDESERVWFDGVEFDGNRTLYSNGNNVPMVFGYIVHSLKVTGCYFHDVIDGAIKLRDGANLFAEGNIFYRCFQNGIELRNYATDPRTGLAYTGDRPTVQGGHRILGNRFEFIGRIEDGGSGIVDGCGVTFDGNTNQPVRGVIVDGNTFIDCLRHVWSENNQTGSESRDIVVSNNTFLGNVYGVAGGSYGKYGVGLIGVKGASVIGNTFRNISNYNAPGSDRTAIVVSASAGVTTAEDIEISGNTIIDDTGHADRTEYGIDIVTGTRVRVHHNNVSGAATAQIRVSASNTTDVSVHSNPGAEGSYSWGNTIRATFKASNLAATNTLALTPDGYADDTEIVFPSPVRLVGIAVKITATIGGGTISVNPYTNSVLRTGLQVVNADFSGGTIATKAIAINHTDAVTIAAGQRARVDVVTSGFSPTTEDIHVTLIFDTDMKE